MNFHSIKGYLREELQAAVMLVANGFADNFDLESLLKLQRNLEVDFMQKFNARSSYGRNATKSLKSSKIPTSIFSPISANSADKINRTQLEVLKGKWKEKLEKVIKGRLKKSRLTAYSRTSNLSETVETITDQPETRAIQSDPGVAIQ